MFTVGMYKTRGNKDYKIVIHIYFCYYMDYYK